MISLTAGRPYLPSLVTDWYAEDPDSRWREVDGSMVFIDVSGFTSMSERLARQGRIGAEEVTAVISETFDELLTVALSFGGNLLKFGGDALLIFFSGDGHRGRSASAALSMRARLRTIGRFDTSAGRVTLRMSAGVHCGLFHFFLVGGSHRELVVAGPAATATVAMESAASTGQILISQSLAGSLPRANRGPEVGPGVLLRGVSPANVEGVGGDDRSREYADKDATALIPLALRPIVLEGGGAEHRSVTVAFIYFQGVDHLIEAAGPDAAAKALDELVRRVQSAADQHQIAFLATDVASDGGKIILCAGAPNATGNDEEHMLLALRDIIASSSPLPIRVGVNRGHVFAGEVGPVYRRTYTVMGDAVNLAARLMAKAGPGKILATGPVVEGSRTAFAVTALDLFTVKGKSRPVQAYEVGEPAGTRAPAGHAELPLIGRTRELSELMHAWEGARQGTGRLVEVTGQPGMGRSRFIDAFLAAVDSAQVLRSELRIYQSATPYFAVRGVLREALGLEGLDTGPATDRLASVVAERAPSVEPWLSLIGLALDLDIAPSKETALLGDEFRRPRLEEAVDELLSQVLTEPVIILIEDAHWMDDASRDLLLHLAKAVQSRPWLICMTRHPSGQGFVAPDGIGALQLELQPLDDTEATALIAAAAREAPLLPHQTRAVARRAQGNPLFLMELVHALQLGEDVEELPRNIEGLIHARIDRLPPRDRTALRHLSVLGTGFALRHAGTVLEEWGASHPRQVVVRLDEFLTIDAEDWCQFGNSLIREVAYAGLPYRSRRELHARVAESVLASPEDSEEHAALLSIHFFHAGRWREAWEHSRIAGDGAKRRYANVESATFYERALTAARRLPEIASADVAAVAEALGVVHDLSGRYTEAGRAFRSARRLVTDPLAEARLRLKEAWIEEKRGRYSQALRWLTMGHEAIAELPGSAAEAMRAQLSVWRSAMRLLQGQLEDAVAWAERAIAEAERAGDRDALAHALYLHDAAGVYLGHSVDESFSRRALAIYEELGDLSGQAIVANNLAGFAYFAGRWSDAARLYETSREARLRAGDPVEAVRAGAGIGEILCDQGDLAGAREVLDEALAVWRAARYPFGIAFVVSQLGRVASRGGAFAAADTHYAEARTIYSELKARSDILETETRIAENLIYQGQPARAAETIATARARAAEIGGDLVQGIRLHLLAGYALVQQGNLAAARQEFETGLEAARARGASYEVALSLEALARLGRLENRPNWRDELTECWSILDGLGVVSVPLVPLKGEDAAAASSPVT